MFWQKHLDEFVARMRAHDLPLLLELWNGSVFDLGTAPRVAITAHSAAALKHFLPPTLNSLDDAQTQKIDHILTKLRVRPGDRLLDIGCGWGALIMRAAEKFGARAVGITLSKNQYELARERIERAGLTGRCEVRIEDYRDVTGTFDRISSVGMFEHVGLKNLRGYFTKMRELLASVITGPGWPAVAVSLTCLGGLGAGVGYATSSCKSCWAWVLTIAGGLLAWLGYVLQVI